MRTRAHLMLLHFSRMCSWAVRAPLNSQWASDLEVRNRVSFPHSGQLQLMLLVGLTREAELGT